MDKGVGLGFKEVDHQYKYKAYISMGLPRWHNGEESACNAGDLQDMQAWSLGQEDSLEEKMATHSSILAWEIPWTEEPGGL